jgi:uncharacterized protein YejL (UPF0352 family)
LEFCKSQQIVINDKLLSQITKNHGVRMASEQAFLDSYEKQKNCMTILKIKLLRSLPFRNTSISNLKMSIQRLHKVKTDLSLSVFGKIVTNSNKMLDLSAQHPEYAIWFQNIMLKSETNNEASTGSYAGYSE